MQRRLVIHYLIVFVEKRKTLGLNLQTFGTDCNGEKEIEKEIERQKDRKIWTDKESKKRGRMSALEKGEMMLSFKKEKQFSEGNDPKSSWQLSTEAVYRQKRIFQEKKL